MTIHDQCYSDVIITGGGATGRNHSLLNCGADLVVGDCETCKWQ